MSLISGLYTSFQGIRDTEAKIAVSTQNVTNADKAGYTRKQYSSNYTTVGNVTAPINGVVQSVQLDPYLFEQVIEDLTNAAKAGVKSDYLSSYVERLGNVGGQSTLNDALDDLTTALDQLSVTPEDAALKSQVVDAAERLADDLRALSTQIQAARLQADQEIGSAVISINESLEKISYLNVEIQTSASRGTNVADFEDERRVELEKIAALVDVEFFIDSNNRMNIYIGDRSVLSSQITPLDYTPANVIDSGVLYPGGFDNITIGGADVTTSLADGKLGGLIELRDSVFVDEQAKLDNFANQLASEMNTLLSQGASIPSRPEMIGETQGLTVADPLAATGNVRIAVTDQNAAVISYNDFDLTSYATIGDLVTDINAVLGADLTASLDANGALVITADNADQGISMNQMDSDIGGASFAAFFGLNNMFETDNGASNITVSDYLSENSVYLATARLSDDVALLAGDTGIFVGDGSLAKELNEGLTNPVSFAAAGGFAAQSVSLDTYADNILSFVATQAAIATDRAETAALLAEQTQLEIQNLTGVNIDEEMTHIVSLEAKYEAAATMIGTIQELFQDLLNAVR
ncbi:MAG: flagellar hook-associated protein FlgK [Alphaproteobacteria bacterium]